MKTVVAAALILALAVAAVAGTTVIASIGAQRIDGALARFPEKMMREEDVSQAESAMDTLEAEFQKWEPWFSLVCPHSDVMHTAEYLAQLEGAVKAKSAESYETALLGMQEAAEHLSRSILPRLSDLF